MKRAYLLLPENSLQRYLYVFSSYFYPKKKKPLQNNKNASPSKLHLTAIIFKCEDTYD